MICEYFATCIFIQQKAETDPITADFVAQSYCKSDKFRCARFCLFRIVSPERVPDHIWPSDEAEAMEIIEDSFRISK
ncbi:MAG TPA: hypothetical protein VMJ66_00090, partial [Geobacteraceae bacterium]|nr:hypothetical protein [Geobacteraceae bacterium]